MRSACLIFLCDGNILKKKKKRKKESKMQFFFSIVQVSEILFKIVYFPKVLQASILDSSLQKQQ